MTIPQAGSVVSGRGKGFLSAVTSAGTHREATPGSVNDRMEGGSEEGKGPHQGQRAREWRGLSEGSCYGGSQL